MTKWVISFAMLFLILTLASSIAEGAYLGGEEGTLWSAMSFSHPLATWQAIGNMLIFNYSFLTGTWLIFRYVFICISVGFFIGLLLQMPTWMAILTGIVTVASAVSTQI